MTLLERKKEVILRQREKESDRAFIRRVSEEVALMGIALHKVQSFEIEGDSGEKIATIVYDEFGQLF